MRDETRSRMWERILPILQTEEGRTALRKKIETPPTAAEAEWGVREGLIAPVMYREVSVSVRDADGHRLCDAAMNTDDGQKKLLFKQGREIYEIPIEEVRKAFEELEKKE